MVFRRLLARVRSLESYLSVRYAEDGYGEHEHVDSTSGWSVTHASRINELEKEVKELREIVDKLKP